MLRALRNSWRLLRMALSFARHNALFPLETLGIAPALIAWAKLFARRRLAERDDLLRARCERVGGGAWCEPRAQRRCVDRAAQREDTVRRVRSRGAPVREVDAGFQAFVADPIGIAP